MSTHCDIQHTFSFRHDKQIKMDCDGGHISSDAGLIALRQFDHQIGFTEQIVASLHDSRNPMRVIHTLMVLVIQELYGLLLAHFAIRGLMHEAALEHKRDPDELSFTHAVRVVRRTLPTFSAFSP